MKKKEAKLTRTSVMKETSDNWYPSFELHGWKDGKVNVMLVEVSLLGLSDGRFRVCVWGADDFGMEIDVDDNLKAHNIFMRVIGMKVVKKSDLEKMEFKRA